MAGVKPPDTAQYFQDQIRDYQSRMSQAAREKEEEDAKRTKEHARDIDQIKAKHEDTRREDQTRTERTVQIANDSTREIVENERRKAKSDVDELRRQLYDRNGFNTTSSETATLRSLLNGATESAQKNERNLLEKMNDQQRLHEKQQQATNDKSADELTRVADESRRSALETYRHAFGAEKEDYLGFKEDAERKYQVLSDAHAEDLVRVRKEANEAIESSNRDFANRLRNEQRQSESMNDRMSRNLRDINEKTAAGFIRANEEDSKELRGQISKLLAARGDQVKSGAEARAEAFREFESNASQKHEAIMSNADRLLQAEARANSNRQGQLASNYQEDLSKKTEEYAKRTSEKEQEAYFDRKLRENQFNENMKQKDEQVKKADESAEQRLERQAKANQEHLEKALKAQNAAARQTLSNVRTSTDTQIKILEKDLTKIKDTRDISNVPPAVEDAVMARIGKTVFEEAETDKARRQGAIDSVQENYAQRLQDTIEESKGNETKTIKEQTFMRDQDRNKFVAFVNESEYSTKKKIEDQEQSHEREVRNLNRNQNKTVSLQRNRYEGLLDDQRTTVQNELNALKQESEFNRTMSTRLANAKLNDTIRTYEQKMSEQRDQFELAIEELKSQSDRKVREQDRAQKLEMETQKRGFDQRVAQLIQQNEEREKSIREQYEETLTKVKRSNERLIRQKS